MSGRAGVPKERPGEAISVGAAWAAVKDPGLKSGEKLSLVIMWWNQSPGRILRRCYWVKVQPSCRRGPQRFGNISIVGQSPRTAIAMEQSRPEPMRDKAVASPSGLEACESQTLDTELFNNVGVCFVQMVMGLPFFPLRVRKCVTYLFLQQEPIVERFWCFRETLQV